MVVETGGEEENVDGTALVRARVVVEKLGLESKRGEEWTSHGIQENGLVVAHDRCDMLENVSRSQSPLQVCQGVLAAWSGVRTLVRRCVTVARCGAQDQGNENAL